LNQSSNPHCKFVSTPAKESKEDSPVLARVLNLGLPSVEETTQKTPMTKKMVRML
jgi:hypothetical protein